MPRGIPKTKTDDSDVIKDQNYFEKLEEGIEEMAEPEVAEPEPEKKDEIKE